MTNGSRAIRFFVVVVLSGGVMAAAQEKVTVVPADPPTVNEEAPNPGILSGRSYPPRVYDATGQFVGVAEVTGTNAGFGGPRAAVYISYQEGNAPNVDLIGVPIVRDGGAQLAWTWSTDDNMVSQALYYSLPGCTGNVYSGGAGTGLLGSRVAVVGPGNLLYVSGPNPSVENFAYQSQRYGGGMCGTATGTTDGFAVTVALDLDDRYTLPLSIR